MKRARLCFLLAASFLCHIAAGQSVTSQQLPGQGQYVLLIHGGAGTILRSKMTSGKEKVYREALEAALKAGYAKIKDGQPALEAVQAAIRIMEDNPLFNAGKGAVFTHGGRNELDAAIMDGNTRKAGAVTGVTTIKNPIDAARAVMERSEHVMLSGKGAEQFAKQCGLTIVRPKYFYTEERWQGLQKAIRDEAPKTKVGHRQQQPGTGFPDYKFGTVGAVALDRNGNLAAGTSTGGMTNKRFGRIGDSPVIGAGTYASNKTAAVSCTGWGEYFIRNVAAYDLSALMEYKSMPVKEAGDAVITKIGSSGGNGGLIALDRNGNAAMPFNTAGMYRAAITKDGKITIFLYND
ncbi:isoaspartyl peptidase/L-asparaginase family protein [Niabella aurantiaca]|uniref:isoaspartyl peptidase/L-asparaginase family protein n=1 Tax=Niabella aurantiaca TaxID=379900 RepID=UPI0003A3CEFA|nr:isoaspartyl peptidase/L-asparaginase [Niabella aurantiaca]